jgi:hypothetical protein
MSEPMTLFMCSECGFSVSVDEYREGIDDPENLTFGDCRAKIRRERRALAREQKPPTLGRIKKPRVARLRLIRGGKALD